MIVGDQSFQREYLRNLFREQSVVGMHAVGNGAEALCWLEQERFDLSHRHDDARFGQSAVDPAAGRAGACAAADNHEFGSVFADGQRLFWEEVVEQGLQSRAGWDKLGFHLSVVVNLSIHLLEEFKLSDRLGGFVIAHGGMPMPIVFGLLECNSTGLLVTIMSARTVCA